MNTVEHNENHLMWATLRAAHEESLIQVLAPDYEYWEEEQRPGENARFIDRIDWLTFAMFCEGFLAGMKVGTKEAPPEELQLQPTA